MRARLLSATLFAVLALPLLLTSADPVLLQSLTAQRLLLEDLSLGEGIRQIEVGWELPADTEGKARARALRAGLQLPAPAEGKTDTFLSSAADSNLFQVTLPGARTEDTGVLRIQVQTNPETNRVSLVDLSAGPKSEEAASAPLGSAWSLAPPLIAILLAFLLRGTLIALSAGVLTGAAMIAAGRGDILRLFEVAIKEILIDEILTSTFHLYILGFVLLLSSTVAVVTRMGGIDGMVQVLLRYAASSRSVQAIAYALGLGIFFDDYANTIIVGNSCGPLFDRKRVSRAKLAYIVDSTAAPIAGIAILSTWVAYQISTYAPQLPTVGIEASQGYALFLQTIPYRFYCMLAIVTVGLVVLLQRDFGPMRKIEASARQGHDPSSALSGNDPEAMTVAKPGVPSHWWNGVLPLSLMIFGTAALIYYFGASVIKANAAGGDPAAAEAMAAGGFTWLRTVLSESDSTAAIFYGSLAAFALAMAMAVGQRLLTPHEASITATRGMGPLIKDAILILILAWSIGAVCTELGTATYLVAAFQGIISGAWLPIILFLASCFVAFATGSSWTTMAIMQPNVVLLAYQLGQDTPYGPEGLLILSIGAVLEGAIFGDHCSPISDTTILSSAASKCNHIEHVRTQAPYALVTAVVAITIGYLPVALFGTPWYVSLLLGIAALFAFLRVFAKPVQTGASAVAAGPTG
ncbi:MAG: Na+/H+ antiporter NhaC family protein [Planctomycetes bacterium]|nr:Na+/H+ antiporter NhaC family protein [Planctomycetota bacterium]